MADEIKEEGVVTPEPNEKEIDLMKVFEEKFEQLKSETKDEVKTLKEKNEILEAELAEYRELVNAKPKVDTPKEKEENPLKEFALKREETRKQQEARLEKEKLERIEKENNLLKLEKKATLFIKAHPYLEEVINERIIEGTITSVEQLEKEFSPAMIKKLKEAEEMRQYSIKNFGTDPLGGHTVDGQTRADFQRNNKLEQMKQQWKDIL